MCSGISHGLPTSLAQHGIPIQMRLSPAFYRQNLAIFPLDLHLNSWYTKVNLQLNLVLSPPMNQRLVSATMAVEPELIFIRNCLPLFWLLLRIKRDNGKPLEMRLNWVGVTKFREVSLVKRN